MLTAKVLSNLRRTHWPRLFIDRPSLCMNITYPNCCCCSCVWPHLWSYVYRTHLMIYPRVSRPLRFQVFFLFERGEKKKKKIIIISFGGRVGGSLNHCLIREGSVVLQAGFPAGAGNARPADPFATTLSPLLIWERERARAQRQAGCSFHHNSLWFHLHDSQSMSFLSAGNLPAAGRSGMHLLESSRPLAKKKDGNNYKNFGMFCGHFLPPARGISACN